MFHINDAVIYGGEGVCVISDIAEKEFAGKNAVYYILKPVYKETATVFVPIENEKLLAKMRPVLSKEEILEIIRSMPQEKTGWIEDEGERKLQYKAVLSGGSRRELICLIRTLYQRRQEQLAQKRKPHAADEFFLKEAEHILHDEFAYVLGLSQDQVLPFILKELGEGGSREPEGKTE